MAAPDHGDEMTRGRAGDVTEKFEQVVTARAFRLLYLWLLRSDNQFFVFHESPDNARSGVGPKS